jgi:hypothetical protein
MKNRLFRIVLLFYAFPLCSQNPVLNPSSTPKNNLHLGFLAGMNISNILPPTGFFLPRYQSYKAVAGARLGLIVEIPLSKKWTYRTGVEMQSKGGQYGWMNQASGETYTFRPVYLEFPTVFEYTDEWFFLGAGPAVGYDIGGKIRYTGWGQISDVLGPPVHIDMTQSLP